MTTGLLPARGEKVQDKMHGQSVISQTGIAEVHYSIRGDDIDFYNMDRSRVAIEIRVTNLSGRPSRSGTVLVQAAPLGAFVPWKPLATLNLPGLEPGRAIILRAQALISRAEPLGSPDRVPPRRLLTALGLAPDSPRKPNRRQQLQRQDPASTTLPGDLMSLLLQETPHWVGNLNVLLEGTDVERHMAKALRVHPGRVNMAWFIVGSAGRDAYRFRLVGLDKTWGARLFDMTTRASLVLNVEENAGIVRQQWLATEGSRTMLLAFRPPADCKQGAIEVHVTQKSTGRTAVVEFSLDANAAGRGCFVV